MMIERFEDEGTWAGLPVTVSGCMMREREVNDGIFNSGISVFIYWVCDCHRGICDYGSRRRHPENDACLSTIPRCSRDSDIRCRMGGMATAWVIVKKSDRLLRGIRFNAIAVGSILLVGEGRHRVSHRVFWDTVSRLR